MLFHEEKQVDQYLRLSPWDMRVTPTDFDLGSFSRRVGI